MARLSPDQILPFVAHDPSVYAQNLSFIRQQVLMLKLDRPALEAASFLDDRILGPHSQGCWLGLGELAAALAGASHQHPLHFIFHAGHVGSTLVSRLLDALGGVLGLREPLPLRVLAEAFDEAGAPDALVDENASKQALALFCALWRRGFPDTDAVVIKATSSAGRLSAQLLRSQPDARAIYMTLGAEPYLATLLAGQNSYIDLRGQASERYRRLTRFGVALSTPLYAMSLGEIAALTWLAETLTQKLAQEEHGETLRSVDFDAFLAAPAAALEAIASHFGIARPISVIEQVAHGPVMQRYSKAPDHPYSPALRQQILAESRQRNGDEIRRGLHWLDSAAAQSSLVASVR